ncbi:MAG: 4Fe-4S dicluster domain-containing protein [Pseudomonadota bacterium]
MTNSAFHTRDALFLETREIRSLVDFLKHGKYTVLGPVVSRGAITCGELSSVDDLPVGLTDEQDAGVFRMEKTGAPLLFGYGPTALSWKPFLLPPESTLFKVQKQGAGFSVIPEVPSELKYAFVGVRSCDLAAIDLLDRVFMKGPYPDPGYSSIRKNLFILAVDCTRAGGTCFCTSMKTGPRALAGFDIALTEVFQGSSHYFLARPGTRRGRTLLDRTCARTASADEIQVADTLLDQASRNMGRSLDMSGISRIFSDKFNHEGWDEISRQCLTCGNCTGICPTCFCTTVEDLNAIDGSRARRLRKWDTCLSREFSHMHGGSIRSSQTARYRQWMTHKLVTCNDQFGVPGCVGCGRCITWCPAGIDITKGAEKILGRDL